VQHWFKAGLVEPYGLTPAQQERLRELSATAALLDPDGDLFGEGRPFIREKNTDNITARIWRDSLPALALMVGVNMVPMYWPGVDRYRPGQPRGVLTLLTDASWVPAAVWDARLAALVIEQTINPQRLLVPRRVIVQGKSRILPVRTRAWARLVLPPRQVAPAPKTAPQLTPHDTNKSG
jgi:hypothetical protein